MDSNTFQLLLAVVASAQIVALAYLAARQTAVKNKLEVVHELVNGLSHEKTSAVSDAARKEGELVGRDFMRDAIDRELSSGVRQPVPPSPTDEIRERS